jgi:predicted metal-dependent hydrolase
MSNRWSRHIDQTAQLPLFAAREAMDAWTVRTSPRARRLSVRVYPAGRVEVVVPPRTPAQMVQQFVSKHRDWIDARLQESVAQQALLVPPGELLLASIERSIEVEYRIEQSLPKLRELDSRRLLIRGAIAEPVRWARLLNDWLTDLAQQELLKRLQHLAEVHGFSFDRLQIRRQRTRWGSCSSSGTISLNVCSLFLRPEVLRYLMIHELCHTRHMNHSQRFWRLVAECEPNFSELDKELTRAWRHVPTWMFITK